MTLSWNASQAKVGRRDLIKRGLVAAAGLLIAKTMSASAEAPAETTPRTRRVPVERAKPATWRTRVRIIEK